MRGPGRRKEGGTPGKVAVPTVGCQQGMDIGAVPRTAERSRFSDVRAKQPVGKVCGGDPPRHPNPVGQADSHQFDRVRPCNHAGHFLNETFAFTLPDGFAAAMLDVAGAVAACGQGRDRPDRGCLLVTQIKGFALRIGQRIIVPRGEAVFTAIAGESAAQPRFGHD